MLGLAREVATAYDLPLVPPAAGGNVRLAEVATGRSDRVAVSIDDEERCPRYAAAVADVRVAPSPAWLAGRLQAAGIRPISNIVDVTNYVMFECGQPLHAYDLPKLAQALGLAAADLRLSRRSLRHARKNLRNSVARSQANTRRRRA